MASLSPEATDPLIETDQDVYTDATVSADFTVESWDWDITGVGTAPDDVSDNFDVTPSGNTLLVEYVDSVGLFNPEYIDYRDPDQNGVRIFTWDDLPIPSQSPDMVAMIEDDIEMLEWTLSVTATGTDAEDNPVSASESYTIRILHNYDVSRDLLTQAVEDRKGV